MSSLKDRYLNTIEVQLAMKSFQKHFASEVIELLQKGIDLMQQVCDKKIK